MNTTYELQVGDRVQTKLGRKGLTVVKVNHHYAWLRDDTWERGSQRFDKSELILETEGENVQNEEVTKFGDSLRAGMKMTVDEVLGKKVEAEFKIGNNKGRPRIWLDGKRLIEAGFVGGTEYHYNVWLGRIECFTGGPVTELVHGPALRRGERKVTGRPTGKPIIDMLGRDVEIAFPGAARVKVVFEQGRITITRAG